MDLENHGQPLCRHHSMKSSDKDSLLGVQPLAGTSDVVTVSQHPRDDLHLLAPHPPAREDGSQNQNNNFINTHRTHLEMR